MDTTGKTGQYLSSNGQGRPRARAARGAPGPPVGDRARSSRERLGVDVRTVRRDIIALRDLGIPVEGERGRGGCYRLKPGYRVPPLMFTTGEAASVALGLMAARRLGLDTESALAKVRRVLPDRTRLGVESLEHTLGFTGELDAAPPDRETPARASPRPPAAAAACTPATPTPRASRSARELSPYGLVAHNGRWYVPAYDHLRDDLRALRADRFARIELAGRAEPAAAPASTPSPSSAARSPASPGRTRSRSSCTPRPRSPSAASPRRSPSSSPTADGTLLRLRADSLDWAAGLLAAAGCDFTVHHPDALRAPSAASPTA